MRKKKPGNSKIQDMKRSWERRYFVLFNDGKLKYYRNVGTATAPSFQYVSDLGGIDVGSENAPAAADFDGDGLVDLVVGNMPMLRRTEGKMVYELRPSADWDKGKAVEWLLERDISPFEADKNANTPLLYSAVGCHHECAKHR